MSKKISELDDAATLIGNELIELVQSGGNNKISLDALFSAPLWGDRAIELNGHDFTIKDTTTNTELDFDFDEFEITLQILDGVAGTSLNMYADNTNNSVGFVLQSANETKGVSITGVTPDGTLTYTADTHIFNGGIIFPTSDPHVAGAWWDNSGTLTRSSG